MQTSGEKESVGYIIPTNWFRPWCPCCVERGRRPGYTCSKAKSRWKTSKAKRTSHGVSSRLRKQARPEKFS